MIAYGRIKARIQQIIDDDSSDTAADILEIANFFYRAIASEHVWQTLLKEVTFNSTVLPADIERPILYYQDDTDYLYVPISFTQRYLSSHLYNFFPNGVVTSNLVNGADGVTVENSTAFSSAAPSTDFNDSDLSLAGEYVQIGENEGMYEIDSVTDANNIVLKEKYRGAAGAALTYEIRPIGTQQIAYTDQGGDALTPSSSALLWYQRRPLPLYNDYDQMMLPGNGEALVYAIHQYFLRGAKYDNDALKTDPSYQAAIARMQPLNPTIGRDRRPRDRNGLVARYGRVRAVKRVNQSDRRILGV